MRALFSLIGLLIVAFVLMRLAGHQAETLVAPAASGGAVGSPVGASGAAPNIVQRTRQEVEGALEQAARRASEAQP